MVGGGGGWSGGVNCRNLGGALETAIRGRLSSTVKALRAPCNRESHSNEQRWALPLDILVSSEMPLVFVKILRSSRCN